MGNRQALLEEEEVENILVRKHFEKHAPQSGRTRFHGGLLIKRDVMKKPQ